MSARQPHELLLAAQPSPAANSLVTTVDGQPVTTTLKVAAGTGSQHKNVLELVRTYIDDLQEFGLVTFETRARSEGQHGGGDAEYAVLNEEQSALLLAYMRNSEIVRQFKKALIRDFFNMRRALAAPALPNFADPAAAARAWADEVEAKRALASKAAQLEHQVADQAPAVAGLKLIADASGSMCFRDAAATLNMPQHALTDYLVSKGWIYERAGAEGYKAYRARLQALDLRYNTFGYESKTTGERKARQQVRITNKGLTRLAEMIAAEAAERKLFAGTPQHQQRLGLDPS